MAKATKELNRSEEIRKLLGESPNLSPTEVVETLAKQGTTVSVHLVYKVKKLMKKSKKKLPANGRKTAAPVAKVAASAAKVDAKVNRSAAIRATFTEKPTASAKEVVETLAGKGISVSEALVYNVRKNSKMTKKRGRPAAEKVHTNGHAGNGAAAGNPVQLILKVKDLASAIGGLKSLKQLVDALAE